MFRKGHPHYGDVMQHMFLMHLARSEKQGELMRRTIGDIWDIWIKAGEDDKPGRVYPGAKKQVRCAVCVGIHYPQFNCKKTLYIYKHNFCTSEILNSLTRLQTK